MCRFSVLSLLFLLVTAPSVIAQDSCTRRSIPISIVQKKNILMRDLTPADFRAEIGGQRIPIASVSNLVQPHRILLLLDASGSMGDKWAAALTLADQLAEARLPDISFGLYVFGEKAGEEVGFGVNNRAVVAMLHEIAASKVNHLGGMTPLRDAILSSLSIFPKLGPGDAIFAITDGGDNYDKSKYGDLLPALLRKRVRLFLCLFFVNEPDAPTPEERNQPIADMATASGGAILRDFNDVVLGDMGNRHRGRFDAAINSTLVVILRQIVASRTIEFDLPAPITKFEKWQLSFVTKAPWSDGAKILYPQILAPCSTSQSPAVVPTH